MIVDHDAPGGVSCTVFELGAILLYLAEKTGTLLPKDIVARYEVIQWMVVQITALGPMLGQYLHFKRFAPKGTEYSLDRYRTQVLRTLDVLEGRLASAPYLGGANYSIADIAAFPWIRNIGAISRQAGGAGLSEAHGLGRDHWRPSSDRTCSRHAG